MTDADKRKLLAKLAHLHQECDCGQLIIKQEPHNYNDGTTHYTHVDYLARDVNGTPMTISIARYLTPDLAELLVLTLNNLPELIEWARKGIEHDRTT